MNEISENSKPHAYAALQPGVVLDAVERYGFLSSGGLLALNSYENRVYKVNLEDAAPVVVKFYRPARWSDAAILEEHAFSQELAAAEISVVPPLAGPGGGTLELIGGGGGGQAPESAGSEQFTGFRYAVYPCVGGRTPEFDQPDDFRLMGRLVARIHAYGALRPYEHRPSLSMREFGDDAVAYILEGGFVPPELYEAYRTLAEDLLKRVKAAFERVGDYQSIRLHGDCHLGNVLSTEAGLHFVDLDDSRNGPAIQDLWMMLSGERRQRTEQMLDLLDGYFEFAELDLKQIVLIEALRTLRMLHYSAWLARRWDDPAFPMHFPWFNSQRYWEEQILALREQMAAMDEEPLRVE